MQKSNSIPPSVQNELLDAASRRNPKAAMTRILEKYRDKPWYRKLIGAAKTLLYLRSREGRKAVKEGLKARS